MDNNDIMIRIRYALDIKNKDSISINWPNMIKRKNEVVKKLTGGVSVLLKKNGVDTFKGIGNVIDKRRGDTVFS